MDLRDEKPSKNYKDMRWVPSYLDQINLREHGKRYGNNGAVSQAGEDYSTIKGDSDLSEDELSMMRAGADYREIMFMRLMRNVGPGDLDAEWYTPYNKDKPKK